jgi:hypothetical protein
MLHGPCRIHYTYLDGKRVSNHLMRDCRTFLRLQDAMELSQGAHGGNIWWVRSMENKKFPTHEHKLAKKTLRDGSNGELTLEDRKRRLCSRTNVVDGDLMKTHVVDVVVHLTIRRSCTRRHNRRHLRTRSHVRLVVISSTPSVQRGSGRRDPPDTPTPLQLSVWNQTIILAELR